MADLQKKLDNGPMLNAYPDSMGGTLADIVQVLKKDEFAEAFQSFYILPSLYHTDLDRGFSVIDYGLNDLLAKQEDLEKLSNMGMDLKLDFILNHASVLSKEFQDIIKNGENSKYKDFFIQWNEFWKDNGEMTEEGYIQPYQEHIDKMFFRKPGLPILMVRMPDGKEVPYWNTFYQEIQYPIVDVQELMDACGVQYQMAYEITVKVNEHLLAAKNPKTLELGRLDKYKIQVVEFLESKRKYLGQMDLNIESELVWDYYGETLKQLSEYGASIVRLDAFAYGPKEPGEKNFLNNPGTWDLLAGVRKLADKNNVELLPEIHASYREQVYNEVAQKGYMIYDFFLPGLIIDALEEKNGTMLQQWGEEIISKKMKVVNMLGCHDGIPLLDLQGLIPEERIQALIDIVVNRGGYVKNLHGQKNVYYQVNATYYSALGEDDKKMLFARALQLFMPGKPQIWYLDVFAGENDHKAVERAGAGGHKEINRTNLSNVDIERILHKEVVKKQLELIKFRNKCKAFHFDADIAIDSKGNKITICWEYEGNKARFEGDFETLKFSVD